MSTLAQRMKEAIDDAKVIPADVARACHITPTSVSNWLTGETKSLKAATAMRAAEFLGVNQMWLAEGRGPKRPTDAYLPPESSNVSAGPGRLSRVPLISSVQAGMWTEIIDHFQPGEAEAWLECHKNLGPHGYALRVSGDSMTAPMGDYSFPNGMILYVNPSADPVPGKFVIVRRNGHEATFKRLVLVDGELYLEALNPDWPHRYIKLTPDDHICGVVVYAGLEMP